MPHSHGLLNFGVFSCVNYAFYRQIVLMATQILVASKPKFPPCSLIERIVVDCSPRYAVPQDVCFILAEQTYCCSRIWRGLCTALSIYSECHFHFVQLTMVPERLIFCVVGCYWTSCGSLASTRLPYRSFKDIVSHYS